MVESFGIQPFLFIVPVCSSFSLLEISAMIETIRKVFPKKKIVIVGDLVADQFLNGTISRVSREAPVFILRHDATHTLPGAAANAAVNLASLGGTAKIIGIVGSDTIGQMLINTLRGLHVDCSLVVSDAGFSTTTKIRVLAGQHYAARQQVIRIDYENSAEINETTKQKLRENLENAADDADAIIVSDYNYGAVFPEIYADAQAISAKRNIPLIVDSRHGLENFKGATTATPNRDEVEQILGKDFSPDDCSGLRDRLGLRSLLVTNGNQGMTLFENETAPLHIKAVGSTEPVDVTGAGDTVIAAYALGLASGLSFAQAANIANHAGGIVVMKKGTACVLADELIASLESSDNRAAVQH